MMSTLGSLPNTHIRHTHTHTGTNHLSDLADVLDQPKHIRIQRPAGFSKANINAHTRTGINFTCLAKWVTLVTVSPQRLYTFTRREREKEREREGERERDRETLKHTYIKRERERERYRQISVAKRSRHTNLRLKTSTHQTNP